MRKRIALLLPLLLPFCVYAQQDTLLSRNLLTVAPLRLADPGNPGVELAYERRRNASRGTQIVAAYLMPAFSKMNPWASFHGIRLGIDEKLYSTRLAHRGYAGAGLVFNNVHFRRSGFYTTGTEFDAKHDTVQLRRTTIAFNLFFGAQLPLGRFMVDFSSGIGIKYRIIKQNKPGSPVSYARDIGAFPSLYTAGRSWTANLPVTLRMGYRF